MEVSAPDTSWYPVPFSEVSLLCERLERKLLAAVLLQLSQGLILGQLKLSAHPATTMEILGFAFRFQPKLEGEPGAVAYAYDPSDFGG